MKSFKHVAEITLRIFKLDNCDEKFAVNILEKKCRNIRDNYGWMMFNLGIMVGLVLKYLFSFLTNNPF
jgi:hypothetical protein